MPTYKNQYKYDKAVQEYQNDQYVTLKELAKKYDFDHISFSKYLKTIGISVRPVGRTRENSDRYEESKKLYEQGYSINEIYKTTKVNKKNFSKFLKDQGIDIRNGFTKQESFVDENYFESIDTAEQAYWLGFIAADGIVTIRDNTYRVTIELNSIDKIQLLKFKNAIMSNAEIKTRKNRPISSITIDRKKMAEDLSKLGCVLNKTVYGFIHREAISGFERDYLRGYLDGDGFIEKNYKKYRVVFTVKSEAITNELCDMMKYFNPRKENCKTFFRIHIEQKKSFFELLDYLYQDAEQYLERKYYTYLERRHVHLSQTLQEA